MGSDYRPVSPDLSGTSTHRPASPRPVSPDLSGLGAPGQVAGNFHPQHHQHGRFGGAFGGAGLGAPPMSYSPTSAPPQPHYQHMQQYQPPFQPVSNVGAPFTMKQKDEQDEYLPDAGVVKRPRKGKESKSMGAFAQQYDAGQFDPTLGVELKTSFPVARIKRIMQADEDIGKVAQVTPHVVSRALELFMIKMIAASAAEARGGGHAGGGKGAGKKITPQHLKQAVLADDTFDFLHEIVSKVPDAPTRVKKEALAGSESEEEKKPRRRAKRRKDSDDI